ncbi:MAG TPA: cation diffusion facilitator family transporter [Chloroflexota bacterium]
MVHETGSQHAHEAYSHAHVHGPVAGGYDRAFLIGLCLNLSLVVVEAGFGFLSGSLALLADAGHNLTDVLALGLAWGAAVVSRRAPSARRTYGWRRSSILVALVNAVVLLLVIVGITWEAIHRLLEPSPVTGTTVMIVAGAGVLVNAISALLFLRGREDDLNIRSAFLHLASDALVSLGVVLAGGMILLTGWVWLDPAISLVIGVVILLTTWGLLRDAVDLAMDAVPGGVDIDAVRLYLSQVTGVAEVHDLHIWAMSTTETALTVHLVMPERATDSLLNEISAELHEHFEIGHATLQIEEGDPEFPCILAPAHEV